MKVMLFFTAILLLVAPGFSTGPEDVPQKMVEPVIVELDEITVVGMQVLYSMKCNLIPQLWERLAPRMQEIKHVAREGVALEVSYGMQGKDEEEIFFVLAGLIVSSTAEIPEGMTYKRVPAHKYAQFTHYGPASKIPETYNYIFNKLLPRSAYDVDRDACALEWYDVGFKMDAADSEFDIYIPVQEKQQ